MGRNGFVLRIYFREKKLQASIFILFLQDVHIDLIEAYRYRNNELTATMI